MDLGLQNKTMTDAIKVLVVDDEYRSRKTLRALLLDLGYTKIHEANDGAAGLQAMRAVAPDIVLLDWEMPDMGGAEFVRTLRSGSAFSAPQVPIIMLIRHGERSRMLEAVGLGVLEFLLKPVSSTALKTRMLSALNKPRTLARRDALSSSRKLAS